MLKVAGHLAIAAGVCFAAVAISTGAYSFQAPRQIGSATGAFIAVFLAGLLVASVVRLIRGASADPYAGAFSGVVAVATFSLFIYLGITSR